MAFNFNFSFGRSQTPQYVERDANGSFWYQITDFINGNKNNKFKTEQAKLNTILSSPAVLKVATLIADITSSAKIESYINNELKDNNYLYTFQPNPNEWQSWTDFLYDYSIFRFTGNAYLYATNDVFYFLNPANIRLTEVQKKSFQNLSLSKYGTTTKSNVKRGSFKYEQSNGVTINLELKNLHILSEISGNITGNWFNGTSRLDALYNVVLNSELSITSKGKNLEYSQKFFATGQHNPSDTMSTPMSDAEKKSIEDAFNSKRQIHATKSKVDFTHLVGDLNKLKLNEAYIHDLLVIADMYGVPKELISVLQDGSTYENQEKAVGRLIDYTIKPSLQQLTDLLESILGVEDLRPSFKHLPFNAVFEAEKVANQTIELNNLKIAQELGTPKNIINDKLKMIYGY